MKPTTFDDLTKALATSTSRRQALKTIAATTVGGILGLSGIGNVFAIPKCHRAGLGCDTNSNCCSGLYCAPNGKCTTCPALPTCNSGCPCPSGQTCQNGSCVATCEGLQQPCTSPSQCCDTGQNTTTCEVNNSGLTVCCNTPGGSCSSDSDCCGLTSCGSNGTCQCNPSSISFCFYNTDCCSNMCLGALPPNIFGACR